MYTYTITAASTWGEEPEEKKTFTDILEISDHLYRLQQELDYFIVLESSPPVHNVNFIQTTSAHYKKGFFKKSLKENFVLEIQVIESDGSLTQWATEIDEFDKLKRILAEYINLQKVPDYSAWEDITSTSINPSNVE